jgi:hypothetical protein
LGPELVAGLEAKLGIAAVVPPSPHLIEVGDEGGSVRPADAGPAGAGEGGASTS